MPRQKPAEQVDALRRQQADIAAKLKDAEARARAKKRDDEQRRERLAGRCVLDHLARDPDSAWSQTMLDLLGKAISRPADRALFPALKAISRQSEHAQDADVIEADASETKDSTALIHDEAVG